MAARIKKGDTVVVISGKEKGKQGKVLEVGAERVMIEGLVPIKRHLKPGRSQANPQGGIVEKNGTIHISNVMPVDPKTKKGTRVNVKTLGDGKKVRVGKSGEQLA
ncbi:MAG: 50S ribosomal protein L24 [Deltaproteobacteria bacterium]|nr:50S ribosomal protein L24 [Deltaproteobacteria bacterium]